MTSILGFLISCFFSATPNYLLTNQTALDINVYSYPMYLLYGVPVKSGTLNLNPSVSHKQHYDSKLVQRFPEVTISTLTSLGRVATSSWFGSSFPAPVHPSVSSLLTSDPSPLSAERVSKVYLSPTHWYPCSCH